VGDDRNEVLKVVSWNMQQNPDAWPRLEEMANSYGAQVALVQEAKPPVGDDWRTHPASKAGEDWAISVPRGTSRRYASAVVVLDRDLELEAELPTPLGDAEYGKFAVSHPGQFAVARIGLPDNQGSITVISLYGIWDRDDRWLYADATLHRAISDLTLLLQEAGRSRIVLAGDLNIWSEWERADPFWAARFDTVFDRLKAHGLHLIGPRGEQPLERCLCRRDAECRHVRTFAFQRKPANNVYQNDFVFATNALKPASCEVIDDDASWKYSDHLPVLATFSVADDWSRKEIDALVPR
jgi:endonuclease/exonuclease/phosphatase family metal-dependent hydrolase